MNTSERKRRLTRLRVQKHRAVRKELCNDRYTDDNVEDSSNESGTSDVAAPGRESTGESPPQMDVGDGDNCAQISANPDRSFTSNQSDDIDSHDNSGTPDRSFASNQSIRDSADSVATDERSSGGDDSYEHSEQSDVHNESNNSVDSEGIDEERNLEVEEIRKWAVESNIASVHLDSLLKILRRRLLPQLPKSSKTFLTTTLAQYNIVEMEDGSGVDGQFVYFGIAQGLHECMNKNLHRTGSTLQLQFNVDGMSMAKSGFSQVWPILCKVFHTPDVYKPFPVAIYCGASKPKNIENYLEQFITEMNSLFEEGLVIDGKWLKVCVHSFICDTPARSMLKCVKGHTGFYACERCNVEGYRVNSTTVFPDDNAEERTDETFRRQEHPEHHNNNELSPLLRLRSAVDMIKDFILDHMHLFFLGLMKKILTYLVSGPLSIRLSYQQRQILSRRLEYLKQFVPCEFQRKPRALQYITKWKATELRFFLLYCGPIVFKGVLNENLYKHFLLLHVACRILCSAELALKRNAYAKVYLKSFFSTMQEFYRPESQVMNAHNLIHVADDALNMQCDLTRISAFPFENTLGTVIQKCIRTNNRPLAQICRRLHEKQTIQLKVVLPPEIEILKWGRLAIDNHRSILKIKIRGSFTLATKAPDNKVLLKTGEILKINEMRCQADDVNNITIGGLVWVRKSPMFSYPCNSRHLKMWELQTMPSSRRLRCNISQVENKMIMLPLPLVRSENGHNIRYDRRFIMPLLHS